MLDRVVRDHNRRFCRQANDPKSVWRRLGTSLDWDSVFCFKYKRTVAKDNTVSLFNTILHSQDQTACEPTSRDPCAGHKRVLHRRVPLDSAKGP